LTKEGLSAMSFFEQETRKKGKIRAAENDLTLRFDIVFQSKKITVNKTGETGLNFKDFVMDFKRE
jgi:hypothetical protein